MTLSKEAAQIQSDLIEAKEVLAAVGKQLKLKSLDDVPEIYTIVSVAHLIQEQRNHQRETPISGVPEIPKTKLNQDKIMDHARKHPHGPLIPTPVKPHTETKSKPEPKLPAASPKVSPKKAPEVKVPPKRKR